MLFMYLFFLTKYLHMLTKGPSVTELLHEKKKGTLSKINKELPLLTVLP